MRLTKQQKEIILGKVCPYCKKESELIDSVEIYGVSYGAMYICRPCNAYVGTHTGTNQSLGRLANSELRDWKKKAHYTFATLWKAGYMSRKDAYKLLGTKLGIPKDYCHIGMFSVGTCKKIVEISELLLEEFRNEHKAKI